MPSRHPSSIVAVALLCLALDAHAEQRLVHWTEAAPPTRVDGCAVYDSVSDRLILLGGWFEGFQSQRGALTSWEMPAGTTEAWSRSPLPSFPGAGPAASALDPVRHEYWQFELPPVPGGAARSSRMNLVDGTTTIVPVVSTGTLFRPAWIGYDTVTDRVYALGPLPFGARDTLALFIAPVADTLRFERVSMAGPAPYRLRSALIVWDPVAAAFLVLGGVDAAGVLRGVLVLKTRPRPEWSVEFPEPDPVAGAPELFAGHKPAYSSTERRFYVSTLTPLSQGAVTAPALWAMDLVPALRWTRLPDPPEAVFAANLAVDTRRGRLLVVGGYDTAGRASRTVRTFDFASRTWAMSVPPNEPELRYGYAIAYDHRRDRVVVWSGGTPGAIGLLDDLWLRSSRSGAWERIETVGERPSGRMNAMLIADPERDRLLLLGGSYPADTMAEPWWLTFGTAPTWARVQVQGTPPDRIDGAILDVPRDRLVVLGATAQPPETAVWELSLAPPATWRRLPAATTIPVPHRSAFVLDSARGRALRYGGYQPDPDAVMRHDEVWGFALAADSVRWERVSESNESMRSEFFSTDLRGQVVVDPARDRLVSFGGFGTDFFEGHVSERADAVALSGLAPWLQLIPRDGGPPPSSGHALVYDPIRDAVVMLGAGGAGSSATTFELEGGFEGWPQVTVAVSSALHSAVRVEWHASSAPDRVPVIRRVQGGIWTAVGDAIRDSDGVLRYTDAEVGSGQTVGYRLAWPGPGGQLPVGEVSFTVGLPARQALFVRGNPTQGVVALDLDLTGEGAARVQLLDLAGRVLIERAVDASAVGRRPFALPAPSGARPGLYFVRLTSSAGVATGRVTLLR
jgi:hypothetical protein